MQIFAKNILFNSNGRRAYSTIQKNTQSQDVLKFFLGAAAVVGLGTGSYVYYLNTKPKVQPVTNQPIEKLSEDKIEKFRAASKEKEEKQKEEVRQMFSEVNDRMIKYTGDPVAIDMLLNQSIYSDLKFYQVKPEYFYESEENIMQLHREEIEKQPIKKAKINERLTHAFEAERILQNVFVKVEDVLQSIEKTGSYKPPGIFMKFYGYIYFEIRRKPIIQDQLIRAGQYISLFDLYFKYQSSVLYYHTDYQEIPLQDEKLEWIPNAYLNPKSIPKIYVSGDVKNVFMQRIKEKNRDEARYEYAWSTHY